MSLVIKALAAHELAHDGVRAQWTPIAQEFFDESGYPGTFCPDHFWAFWTQLATLDMGTFFVAELDEHPVGGLGCLFTPDPLTGNATATEHFWFLTKSIRGQGRIAVSLFNAFEDECDRRGVKTRWFAHIHGLGDDALSKFYQRRGYRPADHFFRKDTF